MTHVRSGKQNILTIKQHKRRIEACKVFSALIVLAIPSLLHMSFYISRKKIALHSPTFYKHSASVEIQC